MATNVAAQIHGWQYATFFACVTCGVGASVGANVLANKNFRAGQILYWVGCSVTTVLLVITLLPGRTPARAIAIAALFSGFVFVASAFRYTNFLSFGGRTLADPAYSPYAPGGSEKQRRDRKNGERPSAATQFWIMAILVVCASSYPIILHSWDHRIVLPTAFASVMTGIVGFGTGRHGASFVRGQWLPATVAFVASIAVFLVPAATYVLGYCFARTKGLDDDRGNDD